MAKEPEHKDAQPVQQQPAGATELHIHIDEEVAQGVYSNFAMVNHGETEFTLDFLYVQPQQARAKVRARIISSPKHTKRLLDALIENVGRYEARFGPIDVRQDGGGTQLIH